jgi:hypothetical protein
MNRNLAIALFLLAPALAYLGGTALDGLGAPSGLSGQRLLAELNQSQAFGLLSPVIILGGATAALALGMTGQVRVQAQVHRGELFARIFPQPQIAHLVVTVMSLAVLATFAGYVLAENWSCVLGDRTGC